MQKNYYLKKKLDNALLRCGVNRKIIDRGHWPRSLTVTYEQRTAKYNVFT